MLLSEGIARKESRWGLYEGALERFTERLLENTQDSLLNFDPGFSLEEGNTDDQDSNTATIDHTLTAKKKLRSGAAATVFQSIDEFDPEYFESPYADKSEVADIP